eukprot:Hpha_TRINITY_DN18887_c0_g1::TRINITY_DN18887_c0_g1_i1::g.26275::m.26275
MGDVAWDCISCGHTNRGQGVVSCQICGARSPFYREVGCTPGLSQPPPPPRRKQSRSDRRFGVSEYADQAQCLAGMWFCDCPGAGEIPGTKFTMDVAVYPGMDPIVLGGRVATQRHGAFTVKGEYDVGSGSIKILMLYSDDSSRYGELKLRIISDSPVRLTGQLMNMPEQVGGPVLCQVGSPPDPQSIPAPMSTSSAGASPPPPSLAPHGPDLGSSPYDRGIGPMPRPADLDDTISLELAQRMRITREELLMTLQDSQPNRLRLAGLISTDRFAQLMTNRLIRVLMQNGKGRLFTVAGLYSAPLEESYDVERFATVKYLDAVHGAQRLRVQVTQVSSDEIQPTELAEWNALPGRPGRLDLEQKQECVKAYLQWRNRPMRAPDSSSSSIPPWLSLIPAARRPVEPRPPTLPPDESSPVKGKRSTEDIPLLITQEELRRLMGAIPGHAEQYRNDLVRIIRYAQNRSRDTDGLWVTAWDRICDSPTPGVPTQTDPNRKTTEWLERAIVQLYPLPLDRGYLLGGDTTTARPGDIIAAIETTRGGRAAAPVVPPPPPPSKGIRSAGLVGAPLPSTQLIAQPPEGTRFVASSVFAGPLRGYYFGVSDLGVIGYHLDPRRPPPDPRGAAFVSCPEFRGRLPGYYFASGNAGLGYYKDPRTGRSGANPFELGGGSAPSYEPQGSWESVVVDPGASAVPISADPLSLFSPEDVEVLLQAGERTVALRCKRQQEEARRLEEEAEELEKLADQKRTEVKDGEMAAAEAEAEVEKVHEEERLADEEVERLVTRSAVELEEARVQQEDIKAEFGGELTRLTLRGKWTSKRLEGLVKLRRTLEDARHTLSRVNERQLEAITLLQKQISEESRLLDDVTGRVDSLAEVAIALKRAAAEGPAAKRPRV